VKPAQPKALVYFRSLGCPKNQVDTEVMLGALASRGYAICEELDDADVVVVNTCSFIESARKESVDAILEVADLREQGDLRALIVAGCLPQRYGRELARELPEVDAFIGTGEFPRIAAILDDALEGRGRGGVYVDAGSTHLYDEDTPRLLIGPGHSAYVKIAEGCDRVCAFCAIPGIRGKFQSRSPESIQREVQQLAAQGVREVNVVSQDTTSYGKDLAGSPQLAELIDTLDAVEGIDWIRLLYLYPTALSEPVIDAFSRAERVLPYIDMPLQHASDRMLRVMRRGITRERQDKLLRRLRERIPGVVLRTTFIVGFPGETDTDFAELVDLVQQAQFDRMGVFRYSDEEGTAAADFSDKVPAVVARERYRTLMQVQGDIMSRTLSKEVGREVDVLVDRAAPGLSAGRLWSQAPEIDGGVLLRGDAKVGDFVRARITAVRDVDLEAQVL
jgi:ribosomal protein S12 methylthiotransferase